MSNGIPEQYTNGNIKTSAVPAVIDLCVQSMKLWGNLTFEDVIEPALDILDNGSTSWYDELAATLRKGRDAERNASGTREEKLQAVADRFYRGDIADDLDSWYRNNGGLLRKADLEAHVTNLEDPISIDYKGYTVCKCSTWTQGAVLLQTLQLLKEYDLQGMGHLSADYIHVISEAMKLSFADRDEFYADPQFSEVPLTNLLSDEYADLRRALINMNRASDTIISGDPWNMKARNPDPHPNLKWPKGTTTLCVADQFGNVISCTPSGWGSYAGAGGTTGMHHGTRLISSLTWDDHPNTIQPGMRPCITLTPTLVLKDGKPILAISVAGGDMQDQTSLNLFLDFVEFDMMPRQAVREPRFHTKHLTGFFHQPRPELASLYINSTVSSSIRNELSNRGHDVSSQSGAIGNPVMIYIDQSDGMLYAAGDPDASNRNVKAYDKPVGNITPQYFNPLQHISINSLSTRIEIHYWVNDKEDIDLSIYNVKGSLIQKLVTAKDQGKHIAVWDCEDVSHGCYIVKLSQAGNVATSKLLLN
jgi:gamma-glutamyltranspeptidase/glutathione hydrolase